MKSFINFIKNSLVGKEIKVRIRALGKISTLFLSIMDLFTGPWAPVSLFKSLIKLADSVKYKNLKLF